jgi:hypothetical protein
MFSRLKIDALYGLQEIKCLVYLDDIITFGETLRDHN